VTLLVLRDEQTPLVQIQFPEAQVGVTYLTKRQPVAALHRGQKRGARLGEAALHRLAIGIVSRLYALGRDQLPLERGRQNVVDGSEHGGCLALGGVTGVTRLGDPLRHHGGAALLHLMEMLKDLGHRPAIVAGTGLPAVAGNAGCDVEYHTALRREMLGKLGQSRMHESVV